MPEADAVAGQLGREELQEVSTMDLQIGRLVDVAKMLIVGRAEGLLAGLPIPSDRGLGLKRNLGQPVVQAKGTQNIDSVRRHLHAGANLAEAGRTFENVRFETSHAKAGGERGTTDSAANDGNFRFA